MSKLDTLQAALESVLGERLKKLVRDPKSVRDWSAGVMPAFDTARLNDAELDQIIAYLKHMAGKKRTGN